jgi:hypothetical protein
MTRTFSFAAALAIGVAGAASMGQAAALPTSVANIQSAAPAHATTVQFRRWGGAGWRGGYWRGYGWRGYGWGWPYYGAAVASGVVVGSAVAAPYYYGPPPAYYAPTPVGPGPTRQCWVDTDSSRSYGYWRPC